MGHQFTAGDLAIIVCSNRGTSPNIGKAVSLTIKLATEAGFNLPDGRHLKNKGPECWLVEGNELSASLSSGGWVDLGGVALVEERHLMPLRGDFAPEQQKAKEAETC
jgi:hypothetical protein